MRYIIIILLACITIGCRSTENKGFVNDLQQDNVNGPAMKIITKTYLVKNGAEQLTQIVIDDFNPDGFVTQDSIIDANNQLTLNKFTYEKGDLKEIQTFLNGKKSGTSVCEYDINGKLKTLKELDPAGKLTQYYDIIKLNRFGLLVSTFSHNANGHVTGYVENHYKGTQRIGGFTKDEKSNIIYRFSITLNQAQDPTSLQEYTYTGNSTKSQKTTYGYIKLDSQKNWTQQICYVDKKPFQIIRRGISYY